MEIITLIKYFLLSDYMKQLWEQLDVIQKSAVSETLHTYGGEFNPDRFIAKHGSLPDLESEKKGLHLFDSQSGILRLFMYKERRSGTDVLIIPDDLKDRLVSFIPKLETTRLKSKSNLPEYLGENSLTRMDTCDSVLDLVKVLRLTEFGKLSVSNKTFLPSKSTIKNISQVLCQGEYYHEDDTDSYGEPIGPIKGFAWPLLIQAANLAEIKGSKLVLKSSGIKALSDTPADTIKLIWQRWLNTKLVDEFNRISEIKGQKRKNGKVLTSASNRRHIISDALGQCPVGEWIAFKDFSRYMQAENFVFDIVKDPWDLYICDPQYGSLGYEDFQDWNILQGRYISCLLMEYAATLGLIDVAFIHPENAENDYYNIWGTDDLCYLSRYDGLCYFRLNDLGAYCLNLTDKYEIMPTESNVKMSVLPNLHISITGLLSFEEDHLLDVYADKIEENFWRFNSDKIIQALEHGHDLAALKAFLSEADEQVLPESVESLFRKLEKQAKSLKIKGAAVLLECIDVDTAVKISQHEITRKLCMLAGEKHLVLTCTEKVFRNALKKIGYGMPVF